MPNTHYYKGRVDIYSETNRGHQGKSWKSFKSQKPLPRFVATTYLYCTISIFFCPFSPISMGAVVQAPLGFINKHTCLAKVNQTFTCRTYSSSQLRGGERGGPKGKLWAYKRKNLIEGRSNHLEFLKLIWFIKLGRYCLGKESVELMAMQDSATGPLNHVPRK